MRIRVSCSFSTSSYKGTFPAVETLFSRSIACLLA
jgi:hypothetical protein